MAVGYKIRHIKGNNNILQFLGVHRPYLSIIVGIMFFLVYVICINRIYVDNMVLVQGSVLQRNKEVVVIEVDMLEIKEGTEIFLWDNFKKTKLEVLKIEDGILSVYDANDLILEKEVELYIYKGKLLLREKLYEK